MRKNVYAQSRNLKYHIENADSSALSQFPYFADECCLLLRQQEILRYDITFYLMFDMEFYLMFTSFSFQGQISLYACVDVGSLSTHIPF